MQYFTDFSNIRVRTFDLYSDRKTIGAYQQSLQKKSFVGIGLNNEISPEHIIVRKTILNKPKPGDKLFIYGKCKMAREHYRQSGYSIVRDRNKADYIVIPDVDDNMLLKQAISQVTFTESSKELTGYRISYKRKVLYSYPSEYARDRANEFMLLTEQNDDRRFITDTSTLENCIYFIPKDCGYEDLLIEDDDTKNYVLESNIDISSAITINTETLSIWINCSDKDIIAKSICQSNWRDYPVTILGFLYSCDFKSYIGGNDFKFVCDTIGYDRYMTLRGLLSNRIITPEDWNMFQKFIMLKSGVDEHGGFTKLDKVSKLTDLARKRYAIAPLTISTPTTFENIVLLNEYY